MLRQRIFGKATLYDLNGNVIFSNADTEEIIVMNISPRDDGYSVCLLKERYQRKII